MRRPYIQIVWLTGLLLVGGGLLILAHTTGAPPGVTPVVATITAIDPTTGLATLQTARGDQFALPTAAWWKVRDTVVCDQIGDGPRTRLQRCRP